MTALAIHVEKLGKRYKIGAKQEHYRTLRDSLTDAFAGPFRRFRQPRRPAQNPESNYIWALKDTSFDIRSGEVVGIIGRNGAGKSTLLKILSRITEPTEGRAEIYGRVGSLLEVGTGFHPELTGRENIYLNGAILGMRKTEIERKFEEIVAFAEIERFIDTPVKHYSSGMYVRLAFAVAAHLEPEILMVDEVLAVGDAAFQKKCLGKMGSAASEGRTVLLVSHNMGAVTGLCQRAIWFESGATMADGRTDYVVQAYLSTLTKSSFTHVNKNYGLVVESVVIRNADREEATQFYPGEDLIVEIWFNAKRRIERPYIWLVVQGQYGPCFGSDMLLDGHRPVALDGNGCVRCAFKSIPLLPQAYTIRMGIRASNGKDVIIAAQEVASFNVVGDLKDYGFEGDFVYSLASSAIPVVIPYEWVLPDGAVVPFDLKIPRLAIGGPS